MKTEMKIEQGVMARIPTDVGEFQLCYFQNNLDDKEHLALMMGDVKNQTSVLVRIHSECFTGDVLGSRRCDCGPQLKRAMELIAEEGTGIIVYLRQEGRGIGLMDKLRAYNLQDEGFDTVDANLMLGHVADGRDYTAAALILQELGVTSLKLMTNNPEKIEHLQQFGLEIEQRIPLQVDITSDNEAYLKTKVEKMRHLLELHPTPNGNGRSTPNEKSTTLRNQLEQNDAPEKRHGRPTITLSYAQSLDGSITLQRGQPTAISGADSLKMTHQLRANHEAILVGIGTVLADDPSLTVRLVDGMQPQPVILDGRLRLPLSAKLMNHPKRPWIFTTAQADPARKAQMEARGITVLSVAAEADGHVSLTAVLKELGRAGIRSVMVEGGARVITSFIMAQLADRLVITIAPTVLGGLHAVGHLNGHGRPRLKNPQYEWLGQDMVVRGDVAWS